MRLPRPDGKTRPVSFSPPREAKLEAYGLPVYAYIFDPTDDRAIQYDSVYFSLDKKRNYSRRNRAYGAAGKM